MVEVGKERNVRYIEYWRVVRCDLGQRWKSEWFYGPPISRLLLRMMPQKASARLQAKSVISYWIPMMLSATKLGAIYIGFQEVDESKW